MDAPGSLQRLGWLLALCTLPVGAGLVGWLVWGDADAASPAVEAQAAESGDELAGEDVDDEPRRRRRRREPPEGRWRAAPEESVIDQIAALEAIGYLAGYEPAGDKVGVSVHVPDRAWRSLNFYTSGHTEGALLVDMDGKVLHEWRVQFEEVFPGMVGDEVPEAGRIDDRRERWRRAHLFRNGDVLGIYEGYGLVKIDKRSKILWARPNHAHHDVQVTPDGHIWVLSREAHVVRRINPRHPILEDFVLELDAEGNELRRWSVLEAIERSDFATLLEHTSRRGDLLHTNTLEVLDGSASARVPAFAAGNLLLSIPKMDAVVVLDPRQKKVVWALVGMWDFQHASTILPNGHLMVFDNNGHRGHSKVVEIDPTTQQVVWSYRGSAKIPFHSNSCGTNQRLPNGNTLITETDTGRAFEVTPDNEIVWEFWNPARAGKDDELIATLFEVERLPRNFRARWAKGSLPE